MLIVHSKSSGTWYIFFQFRYLRSHSLERSDGKKMNANQKNWSRTNHPLFWILEINTPYAAYCNTPETKYSQPIPPPTLKNQ